MTITLGKVLTDIIGLYYTDYKVYVDGVRMNPARQITLGQIPTLLRVEKALYSIGLEEGKPVLTRLNTKPLTYDQWRYLCNMYGDA